MKTTLLTRPGPPGTSPRHGARARDDLLDDLGGRHVALETTLAGGAERAGHAAAGLAGDTDGGAVRVAHQHRLDERAVEELPERLARGALVGLHRAQRRHQVGQQCGDELVALRGGKVRHLGRVVGQAPEVVHRQLLGAEAGQAHLLEQGLAAGLVEVGEVPRRLAAASGLVEDEGKGLDRLIALGHRTDHPIPSVTGTIQRVSCRP
jgi:hypothetical protein